MRFDLDSQVALITGAASGIGAATAAVMACSGAQLLLLDRDPDGLHKVASDLKADGAVVYEVTTDVTDGTALAAAIKDAITPFGGAVDILVNNAGICRPAPFEATPDTDWHRAWDVNFMGAVRVLREVLPGMREQGRGAIVTVASDLAFRPQPGFDAYQAS